MMGPDALGVQNHLFFEKVTKWPVFLLLPGPEPREPVTTRSGSLIKPCRLFRAKRNALSFSSF